MTPERLAAIAAATDSLKDIRALCVEVSSDLDCLHDEEAEAETADDEDDEHSPEADDALLAAYEQIGADFQDGLDRAIRRLEALSSM